MIPLPLAHIAGLPVEETLGFYGPALVAVLSAASAAVGARMRTMRGRRSKHSHASDSSRSLGARRTQS